MCIQIKSLLLSYYHSTSALLREILERAPKVQKQLTYRQYYLHIYRLIRFTVCNIHINILSTHSALLDILTVINMHYTPYVPLKHTDLHARFKYTKM